MFFYLSQSLLPNSEEKVHGYVQDIYETDQNTKLYSCTQMLKKAQKFTVTEEIFGAIGAQCRRALVDNAVVLVNGRMTGVG